MPDPNDQQSNSVSVTQIPMPAPAAGVPNDAPAGAPLTSGLATPLRSSENVIKSAQAGNVAGALSDAAETQPPDDNLDEMIKALRSLPPSDPFGEKELMAALQNHPAIRALEARVLELEAKIAHWHSIFAWPSPPPDYEPTTSSD